MFTAIARRSRRRCRCVARIGRTTRPNGCGRTAHLVRVYSGAMNPAPIELDSMDNLAEALKRSQAQYRSLVESMDLGYILVDVLMDEHNRPVDLKYLDANAKAVQMTGAELVGRTTRELSPDFEPHWFETFGRVATTGVGERHELTAAPLNACYDFYVFKVGAPDTRQVVALYQDITLRKHSEAALRDSEERLRRAYVELDARVRQRTSELAQSNVALEAELDQRRLADEQIKTLFARLVAAQEEERRRLALDVHDQLGQQMTALRMHLELLQRHCAGQPAISEQVSGARLLADELDQTIDFMTWQLRPMALDHLGLSDALDQLVSGWSERFRISARYEVHGAMSRRFRSDVEANLYRLAQEALHNIYKHAGATGVSVSLEHHHGHSVLAIVDDGHGFNVDEVRHTAGNRGLGLVSMRERAALTGGELHIQSNAGGTTVRVTVPAALE